MQQADCAGVGYSAVPNLVHFVAGQPHKHLICCLLADAAVQLITCADDDFALQQHQDAVLGSTAMVPSKYTDTRGDARVSAGYGI